MNQTESTIDFLLSVARDAIGLRAEKEQEHPGNYDVERDPEGFVTSILTALRHWCHRNGLNWETELIRAYDCFVQDLDCDGQAAENTSCPAIVDLQCPKCHHTGHFFIQATENLLIYADSSQQEGDEGPQWGRSSSCACPDCGHSGAVFQFHVNNTRKEACHG